MNEIKFKELFKNPSYLRNLKIFIFISVMLEFICFLIEFILLKSSFIHRNIENNIIKSMQFMILFILPSIISLIGAFLTRYKYSGLIGVVVSIPFSSICAVFAINLFKIPDGIVWLYLFLPYQIQVIISTLGSIIFYFLAKLYFKPKGHSETPKKNFKLKRKVIAEYVILFLFFFVCFMLLAPRFFPNNTFRLKLTKDQIKTISDRLERYKEDVGHYPTNDQGLRVLYEKSSGVDGDKWYGPYYRTMPRDVWKKDFNYCYPGIHNIKSFDLWSYGRDRKPGGKKYDADIGNW